jgi:AAA domain-containing protein
MDLRRLDPQDFALQLEKYFRPQNPVEDTDHLQGRASQVVQVARAIAATGRSIFIWGDRGVGKTSLAVASAHSKLPVSLRPVKASCDGRSTMLGLVHSILSDLLGKSPLNTDAEYKTGFELGPLKVERSTPSQTWKLENANDAARTLEAAVVQWRERFRGHHPIVLVDEFDELPGTERKYFGDLIKQVGDRRIPITLIFCGVSESLDDLLAGHDSASRYVDTVRLERLYLDDVRKILEDGAAGLGVEVHPDHTLRAAQISDGFPHFAHLLGSSILWEWFSESSNTNRVQPRHFEAGILRAVSSTEKKLEDAYIDSTRKYTGGWDYLLWAAADHHQLIQSSDNIFISYCRIVREAEELMKRFPERGLPDVVSNNEKRKDPFDRARFNSKMYHLKDESHGRVLLATRAGWYKFRLPMLRGYCRLLAQRYGISLGTEYGQVSKPYATR